jgi:hypothetical protein
MKRSIISTLAALGALALAGCAPHQRPDFGDAVRHMMSHQYANPSAVLNPDPEPVQHGDGQRLEHVLETYRTETGAPDAVRQEIVIGVGG